MLKIKNLLSKFIDLIGFIHRFMNWGASNLADRKKALRGCTKLEIFIGKREKEQGSRKRQIVVGYCEVIFL